jgi:diguanylate cyclase (GGDEF)-like protein
VTLQRKSLLAAVVVGIIFLGIGLVTWAGLRHEQKVQVHDSLTAISRIQTARLTQELDATARRLLPNTIEVSLGRLMTRYTTTGDDQDQRDMVARLDDIADLVPNVRAVGLVDASSRVLAISDLGGDTASSGRWSSRGLPEAIAAIASGTSYGMGSAFDATAPGGRVDHRYLQVVPVERGTEVIGYIVAEVDMAPVQQLLEGARAFGGSYEARLVQPDPDGAQLITDSRFVAHSALSKPIPYSLSSSPAVLAAMDHVGTYDALLDERGTRVIARISHVEGTDWGLITKVDQHEAYAAVDRTLRIGLLGLLVASLAVLATMALAFRSTSRRIRRISASAEAISTGQLEARVADTSPDELGELARSFDTMADSLAEDVERRQRVEAELAHRARHDALTGLPNRIAMQDALDTALADVAAHVTAHGTVAVLFCDLDEFKTVNDDLGHSSGDVLLRVAARRLVSALGSRATISRFGGDEFVLVAGDLAEPREAIELGEAVQDALADPFWVSGREVFVTASIGVAYASPGCTPETMLRDADVAMYRAKQLGRRRIVVHDESLGAHAADRLAHTTELRRALSAETLRIALQPIVDLGNGEVVAYEALLRWTRRGVEVDAGSLVSRIAELDLAGELDNWVVRQACALLRNVDTTTDGTTAGVLPRVHVNLSAASLLDERFAERLIANATQAGLSPSRICVEVVEDRLPEGFNPARSTLARLREAGVSVALDDFGAGHSSLRRLRDLPVDIVKLDRSLVDPLDRDPTMSAIVGAILTLARRLRLEVVAEGIENELQRAELVRLGCRYGQGYLIGAPELARVPAPNAERDGGEPSRAKIGV